jgi:hypothetical protein
LGRPGRLECGAGETFYEQITTAVCNLIDDVDNAFEQMTIEQPA